MKKFLVLAFFASVSLFTVHAQRSGQTDYKPAPYMFVGVQGGAQTTIANYDQLKLLTPTASVSFGAFFTPTVGARLHVNGMWDKGGIEPDFEYKYKYATTDVDLLLNLCTLFGKKDYYPLNVYLIGGVGLNYAWDNDELMGSSFKTDVAWKDHQLSHNARVGLMFGANISKHWSANLEVNMNFIDDRFNSRASDKDDRMITTQVGLAYKFGFKKTTYQTESNLQETVSNTQSLYEQMTDSVNKYMSIWMKRIRSERNDSLSDAYIQTQRLECIKKYSTQLAGNRANQTINNVLYNPDKQLLDVQFTDMPSISFEVPSSDVSNFKDTDDLQFINTVYKLNPGDQFEILHTEVINTTTNKKYTSVNTTDKKHHEADGYMSIATYLSSQKPAIASANESKPAAPTKADMKSHEMHTEFFYLISGTIIRETEQAKFNELVEFLKDHSDARVNVVGYADAETGDDATNDRIARQRAENVVKALKSAGIASQRITSDSKGAKIQPYPENDKNRVVIVVAK